MLGPRLICLGIMLTLTSSIFAGEHLLEWYPYILQSANALDACLNDSANFDSLNLKKAKKENIDRKILKKLKKKVVSDLQNNQLLYPHLHLKWTRFIKEQQEAFESGHRRHLRVIDEAQHADLKKNRYKVFLGGSFVVLPIGWAVAHTLLFLPPAWATMLGGSIIYFIRGEIIVQRFMDKNRDCYSVLKEINETVYFEKKQEIEQIDIDGHLDILEEFKSISDDISEESIQEMLLYTKYLLKKFSSKPAVSYGLLDQIVVEAVDNHNKDKLEKLVNNIAATNVKRWQKMLFPELDVDTSEASICLTEHFHQASIKRKKSFEIIWEKYFWIEWLKRIKLETKIPVGDFLKSEIIEHLRKLWPRRNVKWEKLQEIKQCLIADFERNLLNEIELAVLGLI